VARSDKVELPELPAFLLTGIDPPALTEAVTRLGFPPPVRLPVTGAELVDYVARSTFR